MPRKPITWVGSVIILAAAAFCSWSLLQYRDEVAAVGRQTGLLTVAVFITIPVAALAIFLLYYFIEKH